MPLPSSPMTISLSGRRIFLASPGDLATERKLCRDIVRKFNEEQANETGVHFMVRGWEGVPPGLGRPQGKINPHLDECDFMVLILGLRWGSPPAIDGPYSSGTEEEFGRCIELLASADAVMRDLAVIFKTIDPERLQDAGPQLEKVINFRSRLEKSKALLFATYDSEPSLEGALLGILTAWAKPLGDRVPQTIVIPTDTTDELDDASGSTTELLSVAQDLIDKKMYVQAEMAYSRAIGDGSPIALTKYANFMRRTGRSDTALELNERLLSDPALLARVDGEAIEFRVGSLTNMGLMYRKRGELSKSASVLREAVSTAALSAEPIDRELCKAYDNYGHTLLQLGRHEQAVEQFESAYKIRKESGNAADIAQSAINVGRSKMATGQHSEAESQFVEALRELESVQGHDHLRANALAGVAEAKLRRNIIEDVESSINECLKINQSINNSDGRSIAHGLYARLLLLEGDDEGAESHAEEALKESIRSNNLIGRATAIWLQAEVAFARGEFEQCKDLLTRASNLEAQAPAATLAADLAGTKARVKY